jgi:predicted lysophospholipase L1 biosynthesis ABC-type transport system permease subunit
MVVIPRQVRLPLSKAAEIAWRGLRVRLTRSLLTLLTIAMSIAFLVFIWTTRTLAPISATQSAGRTLWLLVLSMLVCLVGISNAMLMSVMERFREIGTMKCLGALDSFILKLFFLESLFLGAAGSVGGVLAGMLLALPRVARSSGGEVPWGAMLGIGASSAGIGLLITAAAAVYPAWRAARMDPIEAMRVEV